MPRWQDLLRFVPLAEIIDQLKSGRQLSASTSGGGGGGGVSRTAANALVPDSGSSSRVSAGASAADAGMEASEEQRVDSDAGFDSFNPSWQGFLAHLKSRSAVMLEAYLRRVSPKKFVMKTLTLEASAFDLAYLQDKEMRECLQDCLRTYSGNSDWAIEFIEHQSASGSDKGDGESSGENAVVSRVSIRETHLPGSQAALEVEEKEKQRKRIEREVSEDDVTKEVLATFDGSRIETVKPLRSV